MVYIEHEIELVRGAIIEYIKKHNIYIQRTDDDFSTSVRLSRDDINNKQDVSLQVATLIKTCSEENVKIPSDIIILYIKFLYVRCPLFDNCELWKCIITHSDVHISYVLQIFDLYISFSDYLFQQSMRPMSYYINFIIKNKHLTDTDCVELILWYQSKFEYMEKKINQEITELIDFAKHMPLAKECIDKKCAYYLGLVDDYQKIASLIMNNICDSNCNWYLSGLLDESNVNTKIEKLKQFIGSKFSQLN